MRALAPEGVLDSQQELMQESLGCREDHFNSVTPKASLPQSKLQSKKFSCPRYATGLPSNFSGLNFHSCNAASTGFRANKIPLMVFMQTTSPDLPTSTSTTIVLRKSNCLSRGEPRSTLRVARSFISSELKRTTLPSRVVSKFPEKSQGSLGDA